MMKVLKASLVVFFSLFVTNRLLAQIVKDPTTWTFELKKKDGNNYDVLFHVTLKKGWHIWSLNPGGDGLQVAPEFTFDKNPYLKVKGAPKERGKAVTGPMDGVDGIVTYFTDKVDYTQPVTITANTMVNGTYTYQVCDDKMCLAPTTVTFSLEVKDAGTATTGTPTPTTGTDTSSETAAGIAGADTVNTDDTTKNYGVAGDTSKSTTAALTTGAANDDGSNDLDKKPLLLLFFISLGSGLLAIFTPCIFSMIPITISFFTKRSKTRAEGIKNAVYYSLSIIVIFTVLGVLISAIFGSAALNSLSTDWRANLFFFILIMIFAISFLGAFEITLPSSWTNATDSRAGVGSFMGIFFMALTLVIVSFSCTGPIVGPLLVYAGKGGVAGPTVGMLGFSIGLSLPFALFAIFPRPHQ